MKKSLFLSLILIFSIAISEAKTDTTRQSFFVDQWLIAGPVTVQMPLFANQNNVKGKKFKTADLLKLNTKKVKNPMEGELFLIRNNQEYKWKKVKTGKDSKISIKPHKGTVNIAWLATNLYTDRFIKLKLETETRQCFELYVDGVKKTSSYSPTDKSKKAAKKSINLDLQRGNHTIVIKTLFNYEKEDKWELSTQISFSKDIDANAIQASPAHEQFMDINHLLNGRHLQDVSLSFNGKLVMLRYKEVIPPSGKTENWFEIREKASKTLIYSSEYADVSYVEWVPNKEAISFKTNKAGIDKMFMLDLKTMKKTVLMDNLKKTGYYRWSPTGDFLIYTMNEKPDKNKDGVIHVINMMDRWPWWRSRGQ